MNRCLRILTAVALMALLASPVEGNDDLSTSLSGRRAVLAAIQSAALDAERTAPLAPRPAAPRGRYPGSGGPGQGRVRWGSYIDILAFDFDKVDIASSTGTLTVYQSGQQVHREEIDNTGSLRASSRYDASLRAAAAGVWISFNRPEDSRFSADVRAGALFGDVEIERTAVTLNTVTKTGGNEFGGSFEARFQLKPEADDPYFAYLEAQGIWLDFKAKRDPPELISGATIELDTSDVGYWELMARAGVGIFLGADRKYTIRAGIAADHLDISIDRTLHFIFPAINQRQESESRLTLEKNPLLFNASAHALVTSFLDVGAGVSLGRDTRNAFVSARLRY